MSWLGLYFQCLEVMKPILNIFTTIYEFIFGHRNRVTIYTKSGNFKKRIDDTYHLDFFRKEGPVPRERKVIELLKNNPHPNIITIYDVNDKHCDMEMVKIIGDYDKQTLQTDMKKAKDHLHSLGIIYFDWKPDNTGLSVDGNHKLFDFDACGIIDIHTKEWIVEPNMFYWSYRMAEKKGLTDPIEMDNYTFDIGLMDTPY